MQKCLSKLKPLLVPLRPLRAQRVLWLRRNMCRALSPKRYAFNHRDLLMSAPVAMPSLMRETGFTNNAAAQANEGDKKAQSDLQFDKMTVNVETIPHIKASKQILHDAPC